MRAWTAVTLRDNIATIISYLLHLPSDTFTNELYSSLNLIYQEIKKNNIKVMDLLMELKSLEKTNSISQITMLFKALHSAVPSYCRNAVDNLTKLFFKKKDKLKNVLSTMKESGIDLFNDIQMELMPLLRLKNPTNKVNQDIKSVHGKEYAILFSYILQKKIILSQPVLAVLILNTRFNQLPAQAMEDVRYLADILRNNKIKNWKFDSMAEDPYVLIKMVLISLKKAPELDQIVRDTVKNLLKYLIRPLNTEDQRYYDKMKPFLNSSYFNISLFFDQLAEDLEYTDAFNLKRLINNDRIKYPFALKGFIHHYYDSPNELRLAFLERIKNRVNISKNDLPTLLNVISFLKQKSSMISLEDRETIKKKRSLNAFFDFTIQDGNKILDSSLVICGTSLKYMEDMLNKKSKLAKHNLTIVTNCSHNPPNVSVSTWLQSLEESVDDPIAQIKNISKVLGIFLNNSKIAESVKCIISKVEGGKIKIKNVSDENLNLNQNVSNQTLSSKDLTINNTSNPDSVTEIAKEILKISIDASELLPLNKTTQKNQLIKILKSMLCLKNVRARPIVYYEIIRLYCILMPSPKKHSISFNLENPNLVNITDLIGNNSAIVSNFLNDTEVAKNLSCIRYDDYPNMQLFLVAVFKKMLTMPKVKEDDVIFNEVVHLLRSIIPLPIDLDALTKAIIINSLDDAKYVYIIADFLSLRDVIYNLGDDFDIGSYRTKGSLLYTILQKSLNISSVKQNLRLKLAIQKILPRIDCSTVGAELVKGIEEGATTDMVDFKKLIKNGLNRQNMTAEVTEAFANMTTWHGGTFDPLRYVREMNVSLYETRAEFFEGFFENLKLNIDKKAAEMKKDIKLMKSAIKKDGTGTEPVDYL